ncbi:MULTISPECIES: serine/threonine-protein kinase [unclassified Mycobacterium]|uniref:serine/threonine-protein kinase n=1 Tax=unclassified Mycobacterium TaxID=2642494 RepID=UPI0009E91D27|nr:MULTISPECIES: serine/threonine-protein kinase [unclassified Mycobacterium]
MPLNEGQTFAGYRIIRLLGAGGMGEVYLAQHPRLPRHDALKLLPKEWSDDPDFRSRFIREADLASKLWHPNIVGVHDRGEADGQLWIAMDFVDGKDLGELLNKKFPVGMPVEHVAAIVTAVASALDYAHRQGLLHRDIKPANIMLTDPGDDGEQRVLLTDFGIARTLDDISGLTATNMTVGTVAYSAPEQLMGEDIDGRADQYALAATAYHLLTGSQLFPHSNPAVVISRHLNLSPPALSNTRPDLVELDPVLTKALAKEPEHRFERASDFARALAGKAPEQSASARTQSTAKSPPAMADSPRHGSTTGGLERHPRPKHRGRQTVAIATVVATVVAVALLAWQPWDDADKTDGPSTVSPTALPSTSSLPNSIPPTSAPPAVLPDSMPTNSGCRGDLVTQQDIEHKFLGPVRIFLTLFGYDRVKDGCIAAVTASGKVLPHINIEVASHFGFPSPATDATGNTFITYNPGRYDGVLVLVPTADGFADIEWDIENAHYSGRFAIYYAELVGPASDGEYTIRRFNNDCTPNCAGGTITSRDFRWNGTDYVALGAPVPVNVSPPSPVTTSEEPSLNLERACSDPEWRNANGAEGDRLCGAPNPYG